MAPADPIVATEDVKSIRLLRPDRGVAEARGGHGATHSDRLPGIALAVEEPKVIQSTSVGAAEDVKSIRGSGPSGSVKAPSAGR